MRNKVIKSISLLLALLMSVSFSACSSEKTADNETTAPSESTSVENEETTDAVATTAIPADTDLGGYEFRIYTGEYVDVKTTYYDFDNLNGETINDAVYNRNRKIENNLKCKIVQNLENNDVLWGSAFKRAVNTAEDSFDVAVSLDRTAVKLGIDNYLISYTDVPGLDFTQPYWYKNAAESMTFYDKLFFTFGYDNLSFFDSVYLLLFNKDLFTSYSLDNPYELVRSGKWTMDAMYDMMCKVTGDLNGDQIMTDADLWGASFTEDQLYANFWVCNGETLAGKDADGDPYFKVPGNTRFFSIIDKVFEQFTSQDLVFNISNRKLEKYNDGSHVYDVSINMFANGNSLFCAATPSYTTKLRDMDTDYGIIPFPKYEEVDPGTIYSSRVTGAFPTIIPATNSNLQQTGYILEALACESYNDVIPAYYDIVLKQKQTRDTDSEQMLDMINNNRIIDIGETFWWDEITGIFYPPLNKGTNTIASVVEKNQKVIDRTIDKFISKLNPTA